MRASSLSVFWSREVVYALEGSTCILKSIGKGSFSACHVEIIHFSECPLWEVPLYVYIWKYQRIHLEECFHL